MLGCLLALSTASCVNSPAPTAGPALGTAVSEEKFARSRVEVEFLELRVQEVAANCMLRHGFVVDAPQVDPIDYSGALIVDTPLPLRLEDARVWGYSKPPARERVPQNLDPLSQLSEEDASLFDVALSGSDTNLDVSVELGQGLYSAGGAGCLAEARIEIFGSVEDFLRSYYGITESQTAVVDVGADRALNGALEEWRECMQTTKYDFASPAEAAASFEQKTGRSVDAVEISVAMADASCRELSALHEAYDAAAHAAVARWVRLNEAQVLDAISVVDRAMRGINNVGGGDGG